MRRPAACMALAVLAMSHAGLAEDTPLLRPTRDVEVTYAAAQGGGRLEQRMRWLAAAQTMRIDPPGRDLYVIIDYVASRMSVVRETSRSVVEMAAPKDAVQLGGNSGGSTYVRRGADSVAGVGCTEWETVDRDGRKTEVCISADGVLLRARSGGRPLVTATGVRYVPQDPAAFRVPTGYARQPAGEVR